MGRAQTLVLAWLVAGPVYAGTYTVTTINNSGPGSLRWAINQANSHPGKDTILFDPSLSGGAIKPTTALPTIADPETIINGDIDGDGAPDVVLNGVTAGFASGLTIEADDCTIAGLAVVRFAKNGILLNGAKGCVVRSCHVGVNGPGTKIARNGGHQIGLLSSDDNTIGGGGAGGRNIIAAGSVVPLRSGIHVQESSHNHIRNNNIGIGRDGETPLTDPQDSGVGITLYARFLIVRSGSDGDRPAATLETRFNTVGGTTGERNVLGGMRIGLDIRNADDNQVRSNYFGLARNGSIHVPIWRDCVWIHRGSQGNAIAPPETRPEWRNVISGGGVGVRIEDAGTKDNGVHWNYFGLDAAGTHQRPLATGVLCVNGAELQRMFSNTFAGTHSASTVGIALGNAGDRSLIYSNRFGLYSSPGVLTPLHQGILVIGVKAFIRGNYFQRTEAGIYCLDALGTTRVWNNAFWNCEAAIELVGDSRPNLGNLSNSTPVDDGGNRFYASNTWYIRNGSHWDIKAEGNRFPTSSARTAHGKVWDKNDDGSLGRVDVYPTGEALPSRATQGTLALSGATAVATTGGAEIVFSLSVPAGVTATVLNIAGRPVRTICEARDCQAGINSLVWNGLGSNGLAVPNGRYLVRITARDDRGQSATALTAVSLRR